MTRLLLVAHAPLASAFKALAGHVVPEGADRVEAFDVGADERPDDVERRLRDALGDDEALVLCDVPGATPCNGACRLARAVGARARVVAGLNVPMMWRVLWSAHQPLDALVRLAKERSVSGVDAEPEDQRPPE
jgi:mannose PTS system EIIA component